MTDMNRLADLYMRTLELDAENNPKFEFGMFVCLLGCEIGMTGERLDLGIGKIISKNGETWSKHDQQHAYEVFIFEDNYIRRVFQQDLDRFYLDGSYREAIFSEMRRQGRGK